MNCSYKEELLYLFLYIITFYSYFVTDVNIINEIEMTCKNVIEDTVHEDYESDHDL